MVIAFCNFQFLIRRLWAEILTTKVWGKSWLEPIFSQRQYLWHFLHGGPVQISRYNAGESPPIKAGRQCGNTTLVTASGEHNIFKEENINEVWKSQLLRTLPGQTSKEMLLHMRQQFGGTNILSMPRFCQRLDFRCQCFVDANILSTPRFCQRQYFVDANILLMPIFCRHLDFVDA